MQESRTESDDEATQQGIGENHSGPDDEAKVCGRVVYADDFTDAELLHAKVVRATEPAADIVAVETADAQAASGVEAVLTAADVPNNEHVVFPFGQPDDVGIHDAVECVLADDQVRYVGEPIALVAAQTPAQAQAAANLVTASYEPHEGVFCPQEAMADDAPGVHGPNNTIARWRVREGDIEAGFAEADVVVENTYCTPCQEHAHLEPESGVGWVDDDGTVHLRVATQVTEQYREVANILDLPESKVRIRGTLIGGGFGGKEDLTVEAYLGVLALATESPVKLTYDRDEMFIGRHKRSPFTLHLKHGAREDGRLTALEAELVSDAGAYVDLSPAILMFAVANATGPYEIPNVHVDGYSVLTNNTPGSAFRSFGIMEVTAGIEQQIDALAEALGMDPLEFRSRNYIDGHSETVTGQSIDSAVELDRTQIAAWEALGERTETEDPHVLVGRGIASSWQSYGLQRYMNDSASAWVSLELDGSAVVRSGIPDLGGGQRESLRQIAAAELGIDTDQVTVVSTDSLLTPLSGMVAATRGLFMSGQAVKKAAGVLRTRLVEQALSTFALGDDTDDITLSDGVVRSTVSDDQQPIAEVATACSADGRRLDALETFYAETTAPFDGDRIRGNVFPDYTFSSQAAEVAVDTRTGVVSVRKLGLAHDVGKAVNPARVRGQIEGGALQGLGFALSEAYTLENGIPQQRNLEEYRVPTAEVTPAFETIILESESGKGPYGAKGIGEPAITATAPAILNAINDAIGTRITDLPADPETVFDALSEAD